MRAAIVILVLIFVLAGVWSCLKAASLADDEAGYD